MSHDSMNRMLVTCLVGNGSECMPEGVEANSTTFQPEFLEETAKLLSEAIDVRSELGNSITCGALEFLSHKGTTRLGEKYKLSRVSVMRLWSPGIQPLSNRIYCLGP